MMQGIWRYLWIAFLALYIISPIDGHPLFFDDLIAGVIMVYMLYKGRRSGGSTSGYAGHAGPESTTGREQGEKRHGPLTYEAACRVLGVSPDASLKEISSAYREKMSKSHPDKVSHLSVELQARAKELTLQINEAYNLIRQHRGG